MLGTISLFVRRPQATAFRSVVFQIHLWSGLVLGLYALATGLTGSVLVFEPELQANAYPQYFKIADAGAPLADPEVVLGHVEQAYPGFRVSSVNWPTAQRNSFVSYPSKGGATRTVFAHPYSGRVLGELPDEGLPYWIRELHVYLLTGRGGLRANGIAAGCLVFVCLAGLILWWPGVVRWTRALFIDVTRGWRRMVFDTHSAVGFWTAALLLMWAVTGVYLTFSQEFRRGIAVVSPLTVRTRPPLSDPGRANRTPPPDPAALVQRALVEVPGSKAARYTRPSRDADPVVVLVARDDVGDRVTNDEVSVYFDRYSGDLLDVRPERGTTAGDFLMVWLFPLHAGWFGGLAVKILWAVLGLAFPVMFITGAVMWWNRVLSPAIMPSTRGYSLETTLPPQTDAQ